MVHKRARLGEAAAKRGTISLNVRPGGFGMTWGHRTISTHLSQWAYDCGRFEVSIVTKVCTEIGVKLCGGRQIYE